MRVSACRKQRSHPSGETESAARASSATSATATMSASSAEGKKAKRGSTRVSCHRWRIIHVDLFRWKRSGGIGVVALCWGNGGDVARQWVPLHCFVLRAVRWVLCGVIARV